MLTLLMLGIVPGTNIQISFDDWLRVMALLFGVLISVRMARRYRPALNINRRLRERKLTAHPA